MYSETSITRDTLYFCLKIEGILHGFIDFGRVRKLLKVRKRFFKLFI